MRKRNRPFALWLVATLVVSVVAFYAGVALGEAVPKTTTTGVDQQSGSGPSGGTPLPYTGEAPPNPTAPKQTWTGSDGKLHAASETQRTPYGTWVWSWTAVYGLAMVAVRRKILVPVPVFEIRPLIQKIQVGVRKVVQKILTGYRNVVTRIQTGIRTVWERIQTGWRTWVERIQTSWRTWVERVQTGWRTWKERIQTGIRRWTELVQKGWKTIYERIQVGVKKVVDLILTGYRWLTRQVLAGYQTVVKWVQTGWRWVSRQVLAGYRAVTRWVQTGWKKVTRWVQSGWNWVKNWWTGLWSKEPAYRQETSWEPEYSARTEYEAQYRTEWTQEAVYEKRSEQVPVYRTESYKEPVYKEQVRYEPVYKDVAKTVPNMVSVERTEPIYKEVEHREPVYQNVERREPVYQNVERREPVYKDVARQEPVYKDVVTQEPVYTNRTVEEPVYETRTTEEKVQIGIRMEEREITVPELQTVHKGWEGSWSFEPDPNVNPITMARLRGFSEDAIWFYPRSFFEQVVRVSLTDEEIAFYNQEAARWRRQGIKFDNNQAEEDWKKLKALVIGFLGGSDAVDATSDAQLWAAIAGDTASGFVIYGDLRDLVKEGYKGLVGQETDKLTISLSLFGLACDLGWLDAFVPDPVDAGNAIVSGLKSALKAVPPSVRDAFAEAIERAVKAKDFKALQNILDQAEWAAKNPDAAKTAVDAGRGVEGLTDAMKAARYTRNALQELPSFGDEVAQYLPSGMTMDEFTKLRSMPVDELSDDDVIKLMMIRDSVAPVTNTTVMQKVINSADLGKYFSGEYKSVGGFVSRAQDVTDINTPDKIYKGFGLDYPNSPHTTDSTKYVVRFQTDDVAKLKTPYGANTADQADRVVSGGQGVVGDPPFTGHGFTNSTDFVVPEYKATGYMNLKEGAEIYEITAEGEKLVARFDGEKFVKLVP